MAGLSGIGQSPVPRTAREIKFGQGKAGGAPQARTCLLVGNKTAAGSEAVETVSTSAIKSQDDCDARYGGRSEIRWMYYALARANPGATVYAIAVAENASSPTAASVIFTFTNAADVSVNMNIDWGGFRFSIGVQVGDTAITQCAAAVARINADPNLPFVAVQQTSPNDHKMTVTASQVGPRFTAVLNALRVSYDTVIATTAVKGSVTAGTGADDITNVCTALGATEYFYHAVACTAVSSVTSTDNGVGEYCQFIKTQSQPINGKSQIAAFGLDCTQSQGTLVATSAAANSAQAFFYRVKNNDWFPGMIAAHHIGVKSLEEALDPAANLAGYTATKGRNYFVPDPYNKSDRPTMTEQIADLNNGISPVAFQPNGTSYLVRDITSASWSVSASTKDYRAREGHIPSVMFATWAKIQELYENQRQPKIANDLPVGRRPDVGVEYPSTIKGLISGVITTLSTTTPDGGPILASDQADASKASIIVNRSPGGFLAEVDIYPVEHELFRDFKLSQDGAAY